MAASVSWTASFASRFTAVCSGNNKLRRAYLLLSLFLYQRLEAIHQIADRSVQRAEGMRRAGGNQDDVSGFDPARIAADARAGLAHAGVDASQIGGLGVAKSPTSDDRP